MLDFPDRGAPFRMMICPGAWACSMMSPRNRRSVGNRCLSQGTRATSKSDLGCCADSSRLPEEPGRPTNVGITHRAVGADRAQNLRQRRIGVYKRSAVNRFWERIERIVPRLRSIRSQNPLTVTHFTTGDAIIALTQRKITLGDGNDDHPVTLSPCRPVTLSLVTRHSSLVTRH